MKLDFTKHLDAQDMVNIVMKKKGLSIKESIIFSVNREMYQQILETGYAFIALDLWGHAEPYRKWKKLKEPVIEIEFDKLRQRLIKEIMKKEKVDIETAVSYFLIYTMETLGYHI